MADEKKEFTLDPIVCNQIDEWVKKYPEGKQRSAAVAALRIVQKHHDGWVSKPLMTAIARYLDIPPVWVYEVATFYDMIERKPVGQYKISICTNLSCHLCGAQKVVSHLKHRLGIGLGETTPDGKITLKGVECLAACANAPMCQVNDEEYHLDLTPQKIDQMLKDMGVEVHCYA